MTRAVRLLIDTGFFIALFNERDKHHDSACKMEELLEVSQIVLPWPILYETLNTRLVGQPANMARFGAIVQAAETVLLDDSQYRDRSLATLVSSHSAKDRRSLVDAILCDIIEDVNVPISAMLTFNTRDFLTTCLQNNVEFPSTYI